VAGAAVSERVTFIEALTVAPLATFPKVHLTTAPAAVHVGDAGLSSSTVVPAGNVVVEIVFVAVPCLFVSDVR